MHYNIIGVITCTDTRKYLGLRSMMIGRDKKVIFHHVKVVYLRKVLLESVVPGIPF